MKILGSSEVYNDVQTRDLCVNCGACVGLCPYFVSYKGKVARLFECTTDEGRCHAHCPKSEIDLGALCQWRFGQDYDGSPLGHVRGMWKSRATDTFKGNQSFQNGGTVTALLAAAMDEGIIERAALTDRDGLIPKPVCAKNKQDMLACTGSKYMAAPTLETVNKEAQEGGGKLCVVGTPCQMTALARMGMNPTNKEDFHHPVTLSIGLFCTWALNTRGFMDLVKGQVHLDDIVSMDVPPPPSDMMTLTTHTGVIEIPLDEVRREIPQGCFICPDMTAEFADVSVGALEGEPGWNVLMVRTKKGETLVNAAVKRGYLTVESAPLNSIDLLKTAAGSKKRRALSKAKHMNLLNTDPEKGSAALIVDADLVTRILGGEAS